tara:strand:+ start:7103 stop:7852 length:750 start_codon:yes stop_codon:yes gene_type:complete
LSAKLKAYSVHGFTSLGIACGFFAIISISNSKIEEAFLWLAIAFLIDGIDGSLARKFKVKENTPNIDGAILDNIIDYVNYVVVPVYLFYKLQMVPINYLIPSSILILMVSCYTFANKKIKTDDFYFEGFPALWNLVVLYFYILQTPQWVNIIFVILFALLTFIPLKYVHPFRVKHLMKTNLFMVLMWVITTSILLFKHSLIALIFCPSNCVLASVLDTAKVIWILVTIYFLSHILYQSFKDKSMHKRLN